MQISVFFFRLESYAPARTTRRGSRTYLAGNIFDGGTTHFIEAGALEMAQLIAGELRKNNGRLAGYLK